MERDARELITTKKRKRQPSSSSASLHPFLGTFTRSQHQIYLHRNRSGRARLDPLFCHGFFPEKAPSRTLHRIPGTRTISRRNCDPTRVSEDANDDWLRVLVKDLRARRVFSPAACVDSKSDAFSVDDDDEAKEGSEKLEDVKCNVGNLGDAEDNERTSCVDEEDCVQATPPDAEIFGHGNEDGNDSKGCLMRSPENVSQRPSIGGTGDNIDKKHGSVSGTKPVLNPSSRVRVFRAPGSLSYRRLLPHLMAITNGDSRNLSGAPNMEDKQTSVDKSKIESSSLKVDGNYSGTPPQSVPILANGSFVGSHSNLASCEHVTDSSKLSGSSTSVDEGCSKPTLKEGNEKIKIGASCEDVNVDNLDDFDCCKLSGGTNVESEDCKSIGLSLTGGKPQLEEEVDRHSGDKMQELKTCYAGHSSEAINHNHLCPNLFDAERNCRTCNAEKKCEDNGDILHKNGDSIEESVQRTPLFGKTQGHEQRCHRVDNVLQNSDQVLPKPSGSIHKSSDIGKGSSSKSKLGLNPCSRLKLHKNAAGSFSYRRLLPYLMDIMKDNSGLPKDGQWPNNEKSREEKSRSTISNVRETPTKDLYGKSCHTEHDTDGAHTPQVATKIATDHAANGNEMNMVSPELDKTPTSVSLQQEQEPHTVEITSNEVRQLDPAPHIVGSVHQSSMEIMSIQELSVNNGESCMTTDVKAANSGKSVVGTVYQPSAQPEAADPFKASDYSSKKGILKRNPRGCRGVCTCLNCASFLLHAERAFEFSRNQMQDAEEVAFDLMKELSDLRNILEKSAFGSDDCRVSCSNEVKEACRKASEAEELAKGRLSQMNYDLNIHCRITCGQRPRVRFVDGAEKVVIP